MAVLGATLCAVFMVTVVRCKPVCLQVNEDSSKSSESSSSEETMSHSGPPKPAITGTGVPDSVEDSEHLNIVPSVDVEPSSATPEDPQTSTDIDVSQDMPDLDAAQNSVDAQTVHALPDAGASLHPGLPENDQIQSTKETEVTAAHQIFLQGATPTTPLSFSTATPLTIPIGATLTGAPVCFTIQFTTAEPAPPRGDSI